MMTNTLLLCRTCKQKLSRKALSCPHCGDTDPLYNNEIEKLYKESKIAHNAYNVLFGIAFFLAIPVVVSLFSENKLAYSNTWNAFLVTVGICSFFGFLAYMNEAKLLKAISKLYDKQSDLEEYRNSGIIGESNINIESEQKSDSATSIETDFQEAEKINKKQSEFDVVIKSPGASKLAVVKLVDEITGLGLKEAKELVDSAPIAIKEKVNKYEAEGLKKALEEAGAEVEVK